MNRKNTVLIIDDQETIIAVLTNILGDEFTVYSAGNGQDGIKLAEKYAPDIILLDVLMWDMDGYTVISELKNSVVAKDIPVIFITSLSSDEDEEKGLALGAADYITKPFSPAIVKLRITNQIRLLDQFRTIEKLSMIDQLTELPNRRSFEERINLEWIRASREQTSISLMLIDLDKFKTYNDTYGHLQGDVALKAVANAFNDVIKRRGDYVARWGGEEFIAVLPNTDSKGAYEIAEQLRKHVEEIKIPFKEEFTYMTVSIGVNTLEPGQSATIAEFITGADQALYEAKGDGRNRVCRFNAG